MRKISLFGLLILFLTSPTWAQIGPPPGASTILPNNVYYAPSFTGADFGAQVTACLATVDALGGGTCDARGYTSAQTSSSTITVGDGTHRTVLLLPAVSITLASTKQLVYRTNTTVVGFGRSSGSTITCTSPAANFHCVQSYNEPGGQLVSAKLSGFAVTSTGSTPAVGSVGFEFGGTGYSDVLASDFNDLLSGTFDIGTSIDSVGGCVCYNKWSDFDNSAISIGVRTQNLSGYAFGVNSNQWVRGKAWAKIGLWDSGTAKQTWDSMDFESNTNALGNILYAQPDGNNAGTGYTVGDTVRPTGGDSTAVLTVAAVSGGAVTSLTVTTGGTTYTNVASQATSALTGGGSGLKVDLVISAYELLLSNGGSHIVNPYEEAGAADYICGTGNEIDGPWGSGNGSDYSPRYCTGTTSQYGGTASNFVWGTNATPRSIGIAVGNIGGYIAFNSSIMFDVKLDSSGQLKGVGTGTFDNARNLWADGSYWNGGAFSAYGKYGRSPWRVGESVVTGGASISGQTTHSAIANPSAPTLAATGGTGTSYSYYVVGYDYNGGVTLPSSVATVSGPASLDGTHYITITPPKVDGIACWNVLKTDTAHVLPVDTTTSHICGNYNAAPSVNDVGQTVAAFSAPSANTTGDVKITSLPTTCTGHASGTIWNNSNVLNVCP